MDKTLKILWLVIGFIVLIFAIILSVELISNFTRKASKRSVGLKIIDESQNEGLEAKMMEISFRNTINIDQYVYIPLTSNLLYKSEIVKDDSESIISAGFSGYSNKTSNSIVNFIIVNKNDLSHKMLFPNNLYLKKIITKKFDTQIKHFYLVILSDSNGDGILNSDDEASLFESKLDGSNLLKISDNINNMKLLDAETLLIEPSDKDRSSISLYKLNTEELLELSITEDNEIMQKMENIQ